MLQRFPRDIIPIGVSLDSTWNFLFPHLPFAHLLVLLLLSMLFPPPGMPSLYVHSLQIGRGECAMGIAETNGNATSIKYTCAVCKVCRYSAFMFVYALVDNACFLNRTHTFASIDFFYTYTYICRIIDFLWVFIP